MKIHGLQHARVNGHAFRLIALALRLEAVPVCRALHAHQGDAGGNNALGFGANAPRRPKRIPALIVGP